MKTKKIIYAAIAVLSLSPAAAFGAEPVTDLSAAEFAGNVASFKVAKTGSDPNSQVAMFGMVLTSCFNKLTLSNSNLDPSVKESGYVGFRISDPTGEARKCFKEAQEKKISCANSDCTRLSQVPAARIDLAGFGDARVRIMRYDTTTDPAENKWDVIPGLESELHKSAATLQAEQKAAAEERRQAKIDQLRGQLGCRKSLDDIANARTARDLLLSMKVLSPEEGEKINKQLARAEFDLLARAFKKVKNNDEDALQQAIEDLKAFEADHPEVSESVAVLLYEKAREIATSSKADAASFDKASRLIGEAQSLANLDATAQSKLDGYQRDIQLGKMQKMAQGGTFDAPAYQSLVYSVQNDLRACTTSAQMMGTESCQNSVRAYQTVSQIPNQVKHAQYEQYMFYARMQQTFAAMGQGGAMSGMGQNAGGPFTSGAMTAGMTGMPQQQQQGSGFYR